MHYLLFILLCLIWASSFILMKKAALTFGPITIAGLRCLGGGLLLAAAWGFFRRAARPTRRQAGWLLLTTLLGYGYPYAVQPYLVHRYGSGFIGMMICFVPLLTVLFSMPVLRVFPTRWQLVGVLGGLACMAVILADGLRRDVPASQLLFALSVPASYALCNTIIKRHLAGLSPHVLALVSMGLVALVVLPAGALTEPMSANGLFWLSLACVGILGVLGTGAATVMFFKLVQEQGPLFAGLVTYIVPLGALLWGWADAERVTWLQLFALLGVLGMVAVVQIDLARAQSSQPSKVAR